MGILRVDADSTEKTVVSVNTQKRSVWYATIMFDLKYLNPNE